MKLNLDFSGVTKLKDWWNTVRNNFSTIEEECSDRFEKLNALQSECSINFEKLNTLSDEVGDNASLETEGTLVEAVNELNGKAHVHDNNDVLDGISKERVNNWDDAFNMADSDSHTHIDVNGNYNIDILNKISEQCLAEMTDNIGCLNNYLLYYKDGPLDVFNSDLKYIPEGIYLFVPEKDVTKINIYEKTKTDTSTISFESGELELTAGKYIYLLDIKNSSVENETGTVTLFAEIPLTDYITEKLEDNKGLYNDKADVIINTVSGSENITITDAAGTYMEISGGTLLSKTPSPLQPASIQGVSGMRINGAGIAFNTPLYGGDAFDCSGGKVKHKMKMFTFKGTEKFLSVENLEGRFCNLTDFKYATVVHPKTSNIAANIFCTHFITQSYSNIAKTTGYTPDAVGLIQDGYDHIIFSLDLATVDPDGECLAAVKGLEGFEKLENYESTADAIGSPLHFKAWLRDQYIKGTPVTILYEQVKDSEENTEILGIDKGINQIEVYGESNIKCILPAEIPEPYFAEGDEYYGETLTIDVTTNGFIADNVTVSPEESGTLKLDMGKTNYITATFDTRDNSFGGFRVSNEFVETSITDGVWCFTVYEYGNFNCEFKVSSDSPTGDLYIYQNCYKAYSTDNADDAGDTYTIEKAFVNENSYDFEVEYSSDTKLYIDNKFNELQNAILATGGNV